MFRKLAKGKRRGKRANEQRGTKAGMYGSSDALEIKKCYSTVVDDFFCCFVSPLSKAL